MKSSLKLMFEPILSICIKEIEVIFGDNFEHLKELLKFLAVTYIFSPNREFFINRFSSYVFFSASWYGRYFLPIGIFISYTNFNSLNSSFVELSASSLLITRYLNPPNLSAFPFHPTILCLPVDVPNSNLANL